MGRGGRRAAKDKEGGVSCATECVEIGWDTSRWTFSVPCLCCLINKRASPSVVDQVGSKKIPDTSSFSYLEKHPNYRHKYDIQSDSLFKK